MVARGNYARWEVLEGAITLMLNLYDVPHYPFNIELY